jgi:hypothetical protein
MRPRASGLLRVADGIFSLRVNPPAPVLTFHEQEVTVRNYFKAAIAAEPGLVNVIVNARLPRVRLFRFHWYLTVQPGGLSNGYCASYTDTGWESII